MAAVCGICAAELDKARPISNEHARRPDRGACLFASAFPFAYGRRLGRRSGNEALLDFGCGAKAVPLDEKVRSRWKSVERLRQKQSPRTTRGPSLPRSANC